MNEEDYYDEEDEEDEEEIDDVPLLSFNLSRTNPLSPLMRR